MDGKLRVFTNTSIYAIERDVNRYMEENDVYVAHMNSVVNTSDIYTLFIIFEKRHYE